MAAPTKKRARDESSGGAPADASHAEKKAKGDSEPPCVFTSGATRVGARELLLCELVVTCSAPNCGHIRQGQSGAYVDELFASRLLMSDVIARCAAPGASVLCRGCYRSEAVRDLGTLSWFAANAAAGDELLITLRHHRPRHEEQRAFVCGASYPSAAVRDAKAMHPIWLAAGRPALGFSPLNPTDVDKVSNMYQALGAAKRNGYDLELRNIGHKDPRCAGYLLHADQYSYGDLSAEVRVLPPDLDLVSAAMNYIETPRFQQLPHLFGPQPRRAFGAECGRWFVLGSSDATALLQQLDADADTTPAAPLLRLALACASSASASPSAPGPAYLVGFDRNGLPTCLQLPSNHQYVGVLAASRVRREQTAALVGWQPVVKPALNETTPLPIELQALVVEYLPLWWF